MANLLGEPFDDYVSEQVSARQKLHGKPLRSPSELKYLNGRNAWVKLASGVELSENRLKLLKGNPLVNQEGEGDTLAKQNVLFNGLSDNKGNQRSGISGPNRAYGVGGIEQFGYSPMPGIINMDFKCLNRGSIKKATLSIKAHNRNQFDVIDVLYMRLGYSVLLEWGFDKYLDNNMKVQNTQETLINNWFWKQKKSSYKKVHPKIKEYREKYAGNYDAAFGIISNFSWTFQQDGTYDIKIEIISMGDIIESLKVNLPSLYTLKSNGVNSQIGKDYASLLQENGADAVGESAFYDKLYPGLKEAITGWWDRAISGTGTKENFYNKVGLPPKVSVGSDQLKNWTGIKKEVQTYGAKWECKLTEIEFYDKDGKLYDNKLKEIDEGFAFDDVKKQAVIDGIFQLFNNGTYGSSGEELDKYKNTPFASNFVKETTKFAREYNTENSNGIQTGAIASFQDVLGDDITRIYHYIPVGDKIIDPTIKMTFNDGNESDNEDIDSDEVTIVNSTTTRGSSYTNFLDDSEQSRLFRSRQSTTLNNPSLTSVRSKWNSAYTSTPDDKKWNVILNSKDLKGNNLSKYLGITKQALLTSVYNNFVEKKLADAYPKTPEQEAKIEQYEKAAENGELSKSQERDKYMLEQQMDRLQKDYITKDRNRIYEYFYDQREALKDVNNGSVTLFKDIGGISGKIGTVKEPKSIFQMDIEPLDNQWYIRLGHFLNVLKTNIIPKISVDDGEDPPLIDIDTDVETNICYTIDNVLSLNPKKILIRNDFFIKGLSPDETPVTDPILGNNGIEPFVVNENGLMYGKIMNVYFNINRLEEIFDSTIANKTVSLFKALKTISDDINESLGNINNLEPIIKEENDIYFIDQSSIPNLKKIAEKLDIPGFKSENINKETIFEMYGINYKKREDESNFVRSIGLTTSINKKFATMITIGATSNGTIPGVEATAFSRWNLGIQDKFKSRLLDPKSKDEDVSPLSGSAGKQLQSKYATLLASSDDPWQKFGLSDSGGADGLKTVSDDNIKYTENIVSDFYALMQAETSYVDSKKAEKNPIESSVGFLPFNLKIDIDGLSGIKIYNRIRVQQSFLPSNYPETLEFIITQVNHKLSGDDWVTSLETIATSKSVMSK